HCYNEGNYYFKTNLSTLIAAEGYSGFSLIQNNRAIMHGPNIKSNEISGEDPLTAYPLPNAAFSTWEMDNMDEFKKLYTDNKKATGYQALFNFTTSGNTVN